MTGWVLFLSFYYTCFLMHACPNSICVLSFFSLFFLVMCKDNKKSPRRQECLRGHDMLGSKESRLERTIQAVEAINSLRAELLLDTDELVVLGHTVCAAHRTSLDLTAVCSNCDVSNSGVLSLA